MGIQRFSCGLCPIPNPGWKIGRPAGSAARAGWRRDLVGRLHCTHGGSSIRHPQDSDSICVDTILAWGRRSRRLPGLEPIRRALDTDAGTRHCEYGWIFAGVGAGAGLSPPLITYPREQDVTHVKERELSSDSKQTFLKGMYGLGVLSSPKVVEAFDLSRFRKLVDRRATGHLATSAGEHYLIKWAKEMPCITWGLDAGSAAAARQLGGANWVRCRGWSCGCPF